MVNVVYYRPYNSGLIMKTAVALATVIVIIIAVLFVMNVVKSLVSCKYSGFTGFDNLVKNFKSFDFDNLSENLCTIPTPLRGIFVATMVASVVCLLVYFYKINWTPTNLTAEQALKYEADNNKLLLYSFLLGSPLYIPMIIAIIIGTFALIASMNS